MKKTDYKITLDKLHSQKNDSISLLKQWVEVNSGSENLAGLAAMADLLEASFSSLGTTAERIPLAPQKKINKWGEIHSIPLGSALRFKKHTSAPLTILLAGHMDTVYGAHHPFQTMRELGSDRLHGPGVADMKGGLLVLFKALQALESSPFAGRLGWEVIINPDEEIGSPGSSPLFVEAGQRHHLGLLYEPSFPDGAIVSNRKGSTNYTFVAKGVSVHAGRDFFHGRNAIAALARCLVQFDSLSNQMNGTTVNIAQIESHFPSNIVPDLASSRINVRGFTESEMKNIDVQIREIALDESKDGIEIAVYPETSSPPKPFDASQQKLFGLIKETGELLDMPLFLRESGGTCDGARLHAAGLPNIDTMGVVGGGLHTVDEFCITDSIIERAQLSALFFMRLAAGEIILESKETR